MEKQHSCPVCSGTKLELLHEHRLVDEYKEPDGTLDGANNHHRNYILFEMILKREVEELAIEFLLCADCGLIFFSPRPDETDLATKYELVVAKQDDGAAGRTATLEEHRRVVDLRPVRAQTIRRLLEPHWKRHSGRALDVGGADGHCISPLASDFDCGLLDFENRDLYPGVTKLGDTLDDLRPDDAFDVILCLHTLDHIPDPLGFITSIAQHLSEEGILYIEIPYGCGGQIYRTRNFLTRVNFFSEGSLGGLLQRAGLHVEHMASRPVLSFMRYMPTIHAIGRRDSSRAPGDKYIREGAKITRRQMSDNLKRATTVANVGLVLSRPVEYGVAFSRLFLRRAHLRG